MIEILKDFPEDVLAVRLHGKVTARDYRNVLEPEANARLARHRPLRFFIHLGADYDGIAMGGLVEDARLGLTHWKEWGAIAVVTDSVAVRDVSGFFALFFHHPMRIFFDAEYDEAKAWISQLVPMAAE